MIDTGTIVSEHNYAICYNRRYPNFTNRESKPLMIPEKKTPKGLKGIIQLLICG